MPSFLEIQFPTDISQGVTGGLEFLTDIATVESGQEVRNVAWTFPRGSWDVTAGVRNATDYARLLAFFNVVQGRAYGFRFKDWSDFTDGGLGLVLDNGAGVKYLYKRYTFGGVTYDRQITTPTGVITLAGGGSVASTTGIVTGGTPGTAWTGEFDVPARFDTDSMKMQLPTTNVGAWNTFTVVALR